MRTLHITTSQRIVGKHRNMRRISVEATRDCIERLALYAGTDAETREDARLREELEKRTGCSIVKLLAIAADWVTTTRETR
jgi:hypothetical protein